jgi:N-acetyl-anhydromuramyl-L-alanine amidase AmpD
LLEQDAWDSPKALALRQKLDAWGYGNEADLVRADTTIRVKAYNRKLSKA